MSDDDRYAIYVIVPGEKRYVLAETSRDGIGVALVTLHEEGQLDVDGARVGILDQDMHMWIIHPYKGTGLAHV